jgi:hypothetical protein
MCKRSNRRNDPLVDLFLSKYKLTLLPLPLETAECGQVYIKRPGAKFGAVPGSIAELVTPPIKLPAAVPDGVVPDIRGERSGAVPVTVGLKLLGNFLAALGVPPGLVNQVHAGYQRTGSTTVQFSFKDATRDEMDPFSIGTALIGRQWIAEHPWIGEGNLYYISAAVVRCSSISIDTDSDSSNTLDAGVGVLKLVNADASVSVKRHESGTITFKGTKRLAIGVELYDVSYDEALGKFSMGGRDAAVDVRRGKEVELQPAFPADDDEALLEVELLDQAGGTSQ